jgi:hypothetical protein
VFNKLCHSFQCVWRTLRIGDLKVTRFYSSINIELIIVVPTKRESSTYRSGFALLFVHFISDYQSSTYKPFHSHYQFLSTERMKSNFWFLLSKSKALKFDSMLSLEERRGERESGEEQTHTTVNSILSHHISHTHTHTHTHTHRERESCLHCVVVIVVSLLLLLLL